MRARALRSVAVSLALALLMTLVPAPPPARAMPDDLWTPSVKVTGVAGDILSAIDPEGEAVKRFGNGLGTGLLGVSIGESISQMYNGDITEGLETLSWAVGEYALGLTTLGPFYALGKLVSGGASWGYSSFMTYMVEGHYATYKAQRAQSLAALIENPQRDGFVSWAKGGRGTFDSYWPTLYADAFARVYYIDQRRDEYKAKFSWTERTLGFRLFSSLSQRADNYFKEMEYIPSEAELKQFVWRRWEPQVITEALQEAAQQVKAAQAERNKELWLVLAGRVRDGQSSLLAADRVGLTAASGSGYLSSLGSLTPGDLQGQGRFALGASLAFLGTFPASERLDLRYGDAVLRSYPLPELAKLPYQRQSLAGGVVLLVVDLGDLTVPDSTSTLKVGGMLRGGAVAPDQIRVTSLDARATVQARDSADGFDLDALAGKTVGLLVEVWDTVTSAYRGVLAQVAVPTNPDEVLVNITVPVPEITDAAGDDAAYEALQRNYDALVGGQLDWSDYRRAQDALVTAWPATGARADALNQQAEDLADQEVQYLRVQDEYYVAQVQELTRQATAERDASQEPQPAYSDNVFDRAEGLTAYRTAIRHYGSFLDSMAAYSDKLKALQQQYTDATAAARTHWALVRYKNRYVVSTGFEGQADLLARLVQPYLQRRSSGYLDLLQQKAEGYVAATDRLRARADAMKARFAQDQARVATATGALAGLQTRLAPVLGKGPDAGEWSVDVSNFLGGIAGTEAAIKRGESVNTAYHEYDKARTPEVLFTASRQLEQFSAAAGLSISAGVAPPETFEGYAQRFAPFLQWVEGNDAILAEPRAVAELYGEGGWDNASLTPLVSSQDWTDYINAFSTGPGHAGLAEAKAAREAVRDRFYALWNQVPAWVQGADRIAGAMEAYYLYLKESGHTFQLATGTAPPPPAPAEPVPTDPNIGPGKLLFSLDSNVAWIDGRRVEMDQPPPVIGGRTMVPVRLIGEALGAGVFWNGEFQEVSYVLPDKTVRLRVGDTLVRDGDKRYFIEPAPQLINNRTYVPLRFVSEALGATVTWLAETRQILITKPQ